MTRGRGRERKVARDGSLPTNVAPPPAAVAAARDRRRDGLAPLGSVGLVVLACVLALAAALNVWVKRQALDTNNSRMRAPAHRGPRDQERDLGLPGQPALPERRRRPSARAASSPGGEPLAPTIAAALQPALIRLTDTPSAGPRCSRRSSGGPPRPRALHKPCSTASTGSSSRRTATWCWTYDRSSSTAVNQTGHRRQAPQQLPPDAGQITVMKGNQLQNARKSVKVVRATGYFLLFLVLALVAAAMWIARGRRRHDPAGERRRARHRRPGHPRRPPARGLVHRRRVDDEPGCEEAGDRGLGRSRRSSCATSASTP